MNVLCVPESTKAPAAFENIHEMYMYMIYIYYIYARIMVVLESAAV